MSRILVTSKPAPCNALMAASLPAPGPLTNTLIFCIPWSMPFLAAPSAALCAANAVPFREPLNPAVPALPHATTLPAVSVRVTRVLLKVDWMYALPCGIDFLSLRRDLVLLGGITNSFRLVECL